MIKFNNIELPNYATINDIRQTVLPQISQNTLKINGRPGLIDFGNEIGERTIVIDFTLKAASLLLLQEKIRDFAKWLYYEDEKTLSLSLESDKYYLAKATEQTDFTISKERYEGTTTVTFVCYDPFYYGNTINSEFEAGTSTITVNNTGSFDSYPDIRLNFTESTSNLQIISDDNFLLFGAKEQAGETSQIDTRPARLDEDMSTLTGWTTATNIDFGSITGALVSNGASVSPWYSGGSWGTGSDWHGPSIVKALSSPAQDFVARMRFGNYANKVGQLGTVEMYLLDANGVRIGKISLRNGNPNAITPYLQFYLGSPSNYIVQTYGSYAGVWKNFSDGILEVERIGNKWRIYCAMYDSATQTEHTRYSFNYVDVNSTYMSKVAQIQIAIRAYSTAYGPDSIYITHVRVNEIIEASENENSFLFKSGDQLYIDNTNGEIYLNGTPFFYALDPGSNFIKFKPGANSLFISPSVASGSVTFSERWL